MEGSPSSTTQLAVVWTAGEIDTWRRFQTLQSSQPSNSQDWLEHEMTNWPNEKLEHMACPLLENVDIDQDDLETSPSGQQFV